MRLCVYNRYSFPVCMHFSTHVALQRISDIFILTFAGDTFYNRKCFVWPWDSYLGPIWHVQSFMLIKLLQSIKNVIALFMFLLIGTVLYKLLSFVISYVACILERTFTISANMLQWSVHVAMYKIYVSRDLPIVLNLYSQI